MHRRQPNSTNAAMIWHVKLPEQHGHFALQARPLGHCSEHDRHTRSQNWWGTCSSAGQAVCNAGAASGALQRAERAHRQPKHSMPHEAAQGMQFALPARAIGAPPRPNQAPGQPKYSAPQSGAARAAYIAEAPAAMILHLALSRAAQAGLLQCSVLSTTQEQAEHPHSQRNSARLTQQRRPGNLECWRGLRCTAASGTGTQAAECSSARIKSH